MALRPQCGVQKWISNQAAWIQILAPILGKGRNGKNHFITEFLIAHLYLPQRAASVPEMKHFECPTECLESRNHSAKLLIVIILTKLHL